VKRWTIQMRITVTRYVTVEADDAESAKDKADAVEWIEEGPDAEMTDWERTGDPVEES
jgi:hypothetical protein